MDFYVIRLNPAEPTPLYLCSVGGQTADLESAKLYSTAGAARRKVRKLFNCPAAVLPIRVVRGKRMFWAT